MNEASRSTAARLAGLILAVLPGFCAFAGIVGFKVLDPQYDAWLSAEDAAAGYTGWRFFRESPQIQWPLGANPRYVGENNSIVFSDALPLVAIPLKVLHPWLPEHFQYFGIWLCVCCLLQSYFGYKLIGLMTQDRLTRLAGAGFFSIAPVFLWRLEGHYCLFAQWTVLAALYLYWAKAHCVRRWACLLAATSLIHPYLFVMCGIIWSAELLQRRLLHRWTFPQLAVAFCVPVFVTTMIMWSAGFFMIGGGAAPGFGMFKTELLSMFDPDADWSRIMPDITNAPYSYEGFAFLGIGIICMAAVGIPLLVRRPRMTFNTARLIPILLAAGIFLSLALSHEVMLNGNRVLAWDPPLWTIPLTGIVRASGRLIWPVVYLVYLAAFLGLVTKMNHRAAAVLSLSLLALQCWDSSRAFARFHANFARESIPPASAPSPAWEEFAKRYEKIVYVFPQNKQPKWNELAYFAAEHHLEINCGYVARIDPQSLDAANNEIVNGLLFDDLDPKSLYLFGADAAWRLAREQDLTRHSVGTLDGYRILAPEFKLAQQGRSPNGFEPAEPLSGDFRYDQQPLDFNEHGSGLRHLLLGWHVAEPSGSWSNGNSATILLDFERSPSRDMILTYEGFTYIPPGFRQQKFDVYVNERKIDSVLWTPERRENEHHEHRVPAEAVKDSHGRIVVQFRFERPISPFEVGQAPDERRLGLHLKSLQLRETD